LIFFFFLNNL